ncbi:MAG: hypothetical protein JWM56_661 [Candidatus Peribacteria bacterium]|nr:hypothetical protein [Candidatus Peribacteria bacterium]
MLSAILVPSCRLREDLPCNVARYRLFLCIGSTLMKRRFLLLAIAMLATASPIAAKADFILSGQSVLASASVLDPGATLLDSLSQPLSGVDALGDVLFSGEVLSRVYQEDLAHNALGGLTFVVELKNDSFSQDSLYRGVWRSFGAYAVSVNYGGPGVYGGTIKPISFDRSLNGKNIGFDFLPPDMISNNGVLPGMASLQLMLRTNATGYMLGSLAVINGATSTEKSFAPTGQIRTVPEPGSISLLVTGVLTIGTLGLRSRRRLQKKSNNS